jgi:hypothetical protein
MANHIKYKNKIYKHYFAYSGKKGKTNASLDAKKLRQKGYLVRVEKKEVRMKTGISPKYKKFIFYSLYRRKK